MIQPVAIAPAQRKALAILQNHEILAIPARLQMANSIEVHNQRTMDTQELIRLKPAFDFPNSLTKQMDIIANMEPQIVVLGFDPVNLFDP